ncbi:MAG TPA: hypothetical protein V6C76_07780 [Drouetiella sp.]
MFDLSFATQILEEVGAQLFAQEWFADGWIVSVHPFPSAPATPECITLHVFRNNWFNNDRQGIHFETFIGEREWTNKKVSLAMHIFHTPFVGDTKIARRDVARPFVDQIHDTVASWPGYKFRAGKYGAHPFTKMVVLDDSLHQAELTREIARLCLHLGPEMERVLAKVLNQ